MSKYQVTYQGAIYEATKDLDIADIAKLIRIEITAYIQAGLLPKLKYRVNISRYSGGQSIRIIVNNGNCSRNMNEQEKEVYDCLKMIGNMYNKYHDDLFHSDYWSGNFFLFVLLPGESFL